MESESTAQVSEDARLSELSDITFSPPLYMQRYEEVARIAKQCKPKKVVDIGCGELSVVRLLKFHEDIHELIGLDVDEALLRQMTYLIEPLPVSFLRPLPHPFTISLLHGSITQRDSRLRGCDLAVCVEVIEHLLPDDVAKATDVIFCYMKPTRAVFTTPNSEFNVLFPGMEGFRHYDHKFEWTRAEFQEWGDAVCRTYGYSVEYSGVGRGPEGTEHLGFCTQMAVFERLTQDEERPEEDGEQMQPYIEVAKEVFPFKVVGDDDIIADAQFHLKRLMDDVRWMLDEEQGMFDNALEDGDEALQRWMQQSCVAMTIGGGGEGQESEERGGKEEGNRGGGSDRGEVEGVTQCHNGKETTECLAQRHKEISSMTTMTNTAYSPTITPEILPVESDANSTIPLHTDSDQAETYRTIEDGVKHLQLEGGLPSPSDMSILAFEDCMAARGGRTPSFTAADVGEGAMFYTQWEKGFPPMDSVSDRDDLRVAVPVSRLMAFPVVRRACPNIGKLREVLQASGKFQLTSDGGAVLCELYEDNSKSEMWHADSEDEGEEGWGNEGEEDGGMDDGGMISGGEVEPECWD